MSTGVVSTTSSALSTIIHQNMNIPNKIVSDENESMHNYITLPSKQYIKESILDLVQDNTIGINYAYIINKIGYNYLTNKNICINNNATMPTLVSPIINTTENIDNQDIIYNENNNLNINEIENKRILLENIIDTVSNTNSLLQSKNDIIITYMLELSPLICNCLLDLCSDCCIYIHENKYFAI